MNNRLDQYCGDLAEALVTMHQANWPDHFHYVCITTAGGAIIVTNRTHVPTLIDEMPVWHIYTAYPGTKTDAKPAPSYRDALAGLFQARILANPLALAAVAIHLATND